MSIGSCWGQRVYTTRLHQKTAHHKNNHENSREPPTTKWRRWQSQHAPASEEHLLARAHHAPLYRRPEKTRLGAIEVWDDDVHPRGARDMQILIGNHRSGLKNNQPVNQAKVLSLHWVVAGTLPKWTHEQIKTLNLPNSQEDWRKLSFTSWLHWAKPREKK